MALGLCVLSHSSLVQIPDIFLQYDGTSGAIYKYHIDTDTCTDFPSHSSLLLMLIHRVQGLMSPQSAAVIYTLVLAESRLIHKRMGLLWLLP